MKRAEQPVANRPSVSRYVARMELRSQPLSQPEPKQPRIPFSGRLVASMTLLAMMLILVPTGASAVSLGVLTKIVTVVFDIAKQAVALDNNASGQNAFNQNVVAPPSQITHFNIVLGQIQSVFNSTMTILNAVGVRSSTLNQSQSLESSMFSGAQMPMGSSPSPTISISYANVYGPPANPSFCGAQRAQSADMGDAAAKDALALAAASDQTQVQFISSAKTIESQAATAPPGEEDMLAGHAAVLQLQSYAAQHRLLAAMLRQRAIHLATETGDLKLAAKTLGTATNTN